MSRIDYEVAIIGAGFHTTHFKDVFKLIGTEGYNLFEEWNAVGSEVSDKNKSD